MDWPIIKATNNDQALTYDDPKMASAQWPKSAAPMRAAAIVAIVMKFKRSSKCMASPCSRLVKAALRSGRINCW